MPETKQLTLPVTGMYCANCVATIERNLKKVNGVEAAVVNLSSERATVNFDPSVATLQDMVAPGTESRAGRPTWRSSAWPTITTPAASRRRCSSWTACSKHR
jgi:copper chaperone CopZ